MNKFLTAASSFLVIAFAGCKLSGTDGDYRVSGRFEGSGSAGKYVYLKEVNYMRNQTVSLDSQKTASDGSFSFDAHPKALRIFLLYRDEQSPLILINDERKVHLDIKGPDVSNPVIEGSGATVRLNRFLSAFLIKAAALKSTADALDSAQLHNAQAKSLSVDSLVTKLTAQAEQQRAGIQTEVQNYTDSAEEPAGVFYVLNDLASRTLSATTVLQMSQHASARFGGDGALRYLVNSLKQATSDTSYALLNKTAPDLSMQSLDGKPMKISDFRGKYVLLDFWASWCGPCRAENPNVVKVYNKFKDKNFTILGVSLDQNKIAWAHAVQQDNLEWNQMSDLKQWGSASVSAYKIKGIPFNVLINPDGQIIASNLRGEALERKLEEVFSRK